MEFGGDRIVSAPGVWPAVWWILGGVTGFPSCGADAAVMNRTAQIAHSPQAVWASPC